MVNLTLLQITHILPQTDIHFIKKTHIIENYSHWVSVHAQLQSTICRALCMHDYVTNVNTISISIQKSHDIMTEDHIDTFLGKKN